MNPNFASIRWGLGTFYNTVLSSYSIVESLGYIYAVGARDANPTMYLVSGAITISGGTIVFDNQYNLSPSQGHN